MNASRKRLAALRRRLKDLDVQAFLVTDLTNIAYLSGFVGTAGMAIVDRRATLVVDSRYHLQAQEQAPHFRVVLAENSLNETVTAILASRKAERIGFESQNVTVAQHRDLRKRLKGKKLVPTKDLVLELRMIKDDEEMSAIRRAVRTADRVAAEVIGGLRRGMRERDLAARINHLLVMDGARKPSFDAIVASGARSALVHGQPSQRRIGKRDLIIMDFGAERDGYCSDLTRTVTIGKPTRKQKEIYNIVLEAQQAARKAIRPGVLESEVDAVARKIIGDAGYGEYFGHGLGHGVGRAVHELPTLSKRGKRRLQPGMVVTVEPGIYIPGWGGVRIEDMVVVTRRGCRTLSRAPKELAVGG